MGYVKWSYETLNHFCGDVFKAFGFTEEESNQIKDVLLTADLYGIESHGMQRMVRYHKGIEKGTIHPQAKPEIVFETPISAVIDGHNGMGQLISVYAMKKAIEKAKDEYKKYQVKTISPVEREYLETLKAISNKIDDKAKSE